MSYSDIVGAVGGTLAIVKGGWDLVQWWRSRGRIEVNVVRLHHHVIRYPSGTGPLRGTVGPPGGWVAEDTVLDGLPQSAFTTLELEFTNAYKHAVTLGRIEIDDWVYSERYHVPMYGDQKDYRAFDLFTREPVNLAAYSNLLPGQCLGRRIEILERTYGPVQTTHRQRMWIEERTAFTIRTATSKGMVTCVAEIGNRYTDYDASVPYAEPGSPGYFAVSEFAAGLHQLCSVARWSGQDLIPGGEPGSGGEPRP